MTAWPLAAPSPFAMRLLPSFLRQLLPLPAGGTDATPVPESLWPELCARHPFLADLDADAAARLRALAGDFIAAKQINAAGGHVLTPAMVASIAVQACLPVLELGLAAYPTFSEVIVYPGEFLVEHEYTDEHGVVHADHGARAGEAWDNGPVILSWRDVAGEGDVEGNVVIHEFTHKLDMANGGVDGVPRFYRAVHAGLDPDAWSRAFATAYDDFVLRVEALEADFPPDLDPESEDAWPWWDSLPLDPYAADSPGEFFPVCAEVFFTDPERLVAAYPRVYDLLRRYFLQDPLARLTPSAPPPP